MKTQEATTAKKASSKKQTTKAKTAVKPKTRTAKSATATKPAAGPDSKKAIILQLLRREQGATLGEIAKATEWQNHSIRGFVSAHVTKKLGPKVESTKNENGERTYRILV